jgi:hypothetical protein
MTTGNLDNQRAKAIFKIFILSSIACYCYSLFTGKYGGDYLFFDVTLSFFLLTLNLILNLIPYYVLWRFYLKFNKSNDGRVGIVISPQVIYMITFLLFAYTVFVTTVYGVGKMEADVYDAPNGIKFIIQIMNRISFLYVVLFAMLANKSVLYDVLAIIMILIVSYFTAGMGSLMYVLFVLIIKYYSNINKFYKKYKAVIIIGLLFSPFILNQLYIFRDKLRNHETKEITTFDLLFGKLAGRLSSFPNSAVIIQEPLYFVLASSSLESFYYQTQAWRALVGGDYRELKPEYLMKGVLNDGYSGDINSAFMTSTPGNLIIAFIKSPLNFLLNILTILFFIYVIFKITSFFKTRYSLEFALLLIIYPITSGVASEYIIIITTIIFLFFINLSCNALLLIDKKEKINF